MQLAPRRCCGWWPHATTLRSGGKPMELSLRPWHSLTPGALGGYFFCENSRVKHKRIKVRSYDIECCALDGLAVGKMDDRNARNAKAPWRCPHISMEPGLSFRRLSCYICSISIEHPTVDPATPHRQGFTAPCGPEEPLPRTHPPNELDHAEECFAAFRGCYPQGTRQEAATVLPVCLAFREVRTGWAR